MNFNKKSTTSEVLKGVNLSGKTVIVTGGSTGLGAETAKSLAKVGAELTIVARSESKLAKVAEEIESISGKKPQVGSLELDKPETIRRFTGDWLSKNKKLDILINNAGIMATPFTRTKEGWESQFATNHLGHFLLTNLLCDALKASGTARVVNLSSSGHLFSPVDLEDPNFEARDYDPMIAYGQSKTANVWFSLEIGKRWGKYGVSSFSVHPGGILTELGRNLDPSVQEQMKTMMETLKDILKTIPQGAATTVWAATSESLNGKTGLYLEDCNISKLTNGNPAEGGHAAYAYDQESSAKLWDISNELHGTNF